jgi:O-antigen/teichoic acid export membrane protein
MSDVGVYSLGYRIAAVINILIILPFSYVWAPIRMEYANNKNNKDFVKIVFSYFSLIGFMFIVFFILFTESILPIFIQNADFYEASRVIPLVMLGLFFYSYQNIIDFGIYLHQKVYYYIIVSILTIVLNVILNFWLLPKFGLISAAYITIITYLFSSTLIYIISNRYYKLKLEWKKLIILILLLITIYSIINFLKFEIDFPSKVLIYIILSFFVYKFWLNGSERNFLKTQLNNFNKI